MSFRLDQLLKASTVRVSASGKAYEGMGFFFAPGLALTSAHVVSQAEGEMVQVFLPGEKHAVPAEVKYRFPDEVGLIILQVQTTEALPCTYLDADIKPGDQGYTFGCTRKSRQIHRVMLECEGMMGSAIGISHLAGRNKHLQLNGAPILNQRTGKVCGIVHTPKKSNAHRGEAVPMGVLFSEFPALSILQKEYHCQDNRWTTLLHPDLEAIESDWSYYNRGWIRREQSIRALLFLLRTASQWALIGARMRHVFPWRSIIALIKQTFRGNLGNELQRQYTHVTRQLVTAVDPHSNTQARSLHRLDAQSWVVSSLMEILLGPEQDYASTSRLLWMLEILNEQRVYIQTLKRMPGNFYPQLEAFKQRWKLLEHDERYIDTSRVLSGLINRNTDTNFSLWYTMKFFLKDFMLDLTQNSKLSAHGLERLFNVLVVNLRHAVPTPTASVEDLLRDLEEEVRQHPELKVLQKVQILMTSVSGELVQGGPYRALQGGSSYHFSPKCQLYPTRAQAEAMSQIMCYDTEAEASQHHKPCRNCLNAEKMLNRRLADWHEGEPSDTNFTDVAAIAATETVVLEQATIQAPNAQATLNHGNNNVTVLPVAQTQPPAVTATPAPAMTADSSVAAVGSQLPVTERVIAVAPAADAPIPEITSELAVSTPIAATTAQTDNLDPATQTASSAELAPQAALPNTEVEAAHGEDWEVVSSQVEAELAAAIAAVARELATEAEQGPPAIPEETPIATAADLYAINTDEVSDDDNEVDSLEMATFFVPDGEQPAIELTDTAVTEAAAAETDISSQSAAAPAPEVTVTPAPKAPKSQTPPRQSRSTKQKQTKTLKDFVAAISSTSKTLETAILAQQETTSEVAPAASALEETPGKVVELSSKQAQQRRKQTVSSNPASTSKVAAKAAPQSAKSVKVQPEQVTNKPTNKTKASSKTRTKNTQAPAPAQAASTKTTETLAPTTSKANATANTAVKGQVTDAPNSTLKPAQKRTANIRKSNADRKSNATPQATDTTSPSMSVPTKANVQGSQAKRLADWISPDAIVPPLPSEDAHSTTTDVTSAPPKSTRQRNPKSASKRSPKQD